MKTVLFTFAAMVLVLAVLEVVLRIAGAYFDMPFYREASDKAEKDIRVFDSDILFRLKPNMETEIEGIVLRTNSMGLRNKELQFPKPANTFRILSLGESSTMGFGVNGEETYSYKLEQYLTADCPGRMFEVINAGCIGWTSFQNLAFLKKTGLSMEPDLVLFYVLHNDLNDLVPLEENRAFIKRTGMKITPKGPRNRWLNVTDREAAWIAHFIGDPKRVYPRSAIVRLIGFRVRKFLKGGDKNGVKYNHVRVTEEDRRNNLKELAAVCREHGIKLVMYIPSIRAEHALPLWLGDRYGEFLRQAARENPEAYLLDLNTLFAAEDPDLFFQPDYVHPTVYGHQRIAEETFAFLRANDLFCKPGQASGFIP